MGENLLFFFQSSLDFASGYLVDLSTGLCPESRTFL